jgi:hypothetical protein
VQNTGVGWADELVFLLSHGVNSHTLKYRSFWLAKSADSVLCRRHRSDSPVTYVTQCEPALFA